MKRCGAALCALLLALSMNGCQPHTIESNTPTPPAAQQEASPLEQSIAEARAAVLADPHPDEGAPAEPFAAEEGYLALPAAAQEHYRALQQAFAAGEPTTFAAETLGYDALDALYLAYAALCADDPRFECFATLSEQVKGEQTTALTLTFLSPATGEPLAGDALAAEAAQFDDACARILLGMPADASLYDRYRYLAAVITLQASYDEELTGARPTVTAYNGVCGGKAICQGYARAYTLLCRQAKLPCREVAGSAQGEAHLWNKICLPSGWVHVDLTWADRADDAVDSAAWLRYFACSDDEIRTDHHIDE